VTVHGRNGDGLAHSGSTACSHAWNKERNDTREGIGCGSAHVGLAAFYFLRCFGLPPDANVLLHMRRQVRLHLIMDDP
jgi:hypothetical protein